MTEARTPKPTDSAWRGLMADADDVESPAPFDQAEIERICAEADHVDNFHRIFDLSCNEWEDRA